MNVSEKLKDEKVFVEGPVLPTYTMSSFLTFFHSLLSEGIIPEKEDFHVFVWYGDGYLSGKDVHITHETFTDPIFNYLDDTTLVEKSSVNLHSMYHEYRMEYTKGKWRLIKEWHRPSTCRINT